MSLENHPKSDHQAIRSSQSPLSRRLARGDILLLDGATGTELQRRHVPATLPLWSAQALIEHPKIVQQIHEKYSVAGVDIITTNTFRTTSRTIRKAGMSEPDAKALTSQAVALAKAAAATSERPVLLAGSIAPLEDCYSPNLTPAFGQALIEHRAQARTLANAGVDFILIETMPTVGEAEAATIAATETGLDVVVSVVCQDAGRLLSGEPLAQAVKRVSPHGVVALLVNCSTPIVIQRALTELADLTDLPAGGYANAGRVDTETGWAPDTELTPARYAETVMRWCESGAQIVGGCCGTTPAHIAAIRTLLDARSKE